MNDHVELPNLPGYFSVKEAAKALGGISEQRVYAYINEGRLRAIRLGRTIAIPQEDVESFEPNLTGRPRKSAPLWRVPPSDNRLRMTLIVVQMNKGQHNKLAKRLEEIRQAGTHLFTGSVARYIAESETIIGQVEIEIVWRGVVALEEAEVEKELEDFKQALSDILDWSTAQYHTSRILLHTSGQ